MNRRKKRWKQTVIFLVSALFVCLAASLFLTEAGITRLYPFAVRTQTEEISPSGNSYTVYHNLRSSVGAAEMIVVGVDLNIGESYDLLGHFMRFAKQYSEIGIVLLPVSEGDAEEINQFLTAESSEIQRKREELLKSMPHFSVDFIDFLTELAYVNATVVPTRKFTASAYLNEDGTVSYDMIRKAKEEAKENHRTCFTAADISVVESELNDELATMFDENLFLLKTRYSGKDYSGASALQLPFVGSMPEYYLVSGRELVWFNHYANRVLNFFNDGETVDYAEKISGVRWQDYFFVIANGTPVIYEKTEKTT